MAKAPRQDAFNKQTAVAGEVSVSRNSTFNKLSSESELFDDGAVTLDVLLLKVTEEVTAMTDHFMQTSAAVVVFLVHFEVLGQRVDPESEDRDLYLGRTRVALVCLILLDKFLFLFLCNHNNHLFDFFLSLSVRRVIPLP